MRGYAARVAALALSWSYKWNHCPRGVEDGNRLHVTAGGGGESSSHTGRSLGVLLVPTSPRNVGLTRKAETGPGVSVRMTGST